MDSLPDSTGEWLFFVFNLVVGGLLMNLLAQKAEGPFDKLLEWVHAPFVERSNVKQQEIERLLNILKSDKISAGLLYTKELRARVDENTVIILMILLLIIGYLTRQVEQLLALILLLASVVMLFAAFHLQNKHAALTEAIKRYEKLQDNQSLSTNGSPKEDE